MNRSLTDIDFMGYGKQVNQIMEMFVDLGYTRSHDDVETILMGRLIYYSAHNPDIHVDVFLDKLRMCHTLDFAGRLELDNQTISVSDLLLEKMQIVNLTEKDIKDTTVLLREHEVDFVEGRDIIDLRYISGLLSKDWGFYYTVVTNLNKIKTSDSQDLILPVSDRAVVNRRIDSLLKAIEQCPKSFQWKIRAKIGPRVKWYNDVEDTAR